MPIRRKPRLPETFQEPCECDLENICPEPIPEPIEVEEECPDRIVNYTQFSDYILASLGAPVVCVEVDPNQMRAVIDDCIMLTQRYLGGEGSYDAVVPIELVPGVAEYKITSPNILNVIRILSGYGPGDILNWFSAEHHLLYPALLSGNMWRGGTGDGGRAILGNWESQMQYIKDISMTFDKKFEIVWREQAKILTLMPTPRDHITVGLLCTVKEDCIHLYNNILFRKLAIAACGKLWARNLLKFSSLTLPGGSQIAASEMNSTWTTEYDQWLERIRTEGDSFSFTPSFG